MNNDTIAPFSKEAKSLKKGLYEHYKGNRYEVIAVGRHSESLEEHVIYRAAYGEGDFWVRPLKEFCERVTVESSLVPRFLYLGIIP